MCLEDECHPKSPVGSYSESLKIWTYEACIWSNKHFVLMLAVHSADNKANMTIWGVWGIQAIQWPLWNVLRQANSSVRKLRKEKRPLSPLWRSRCAKFFRILTNLAPLTAKKGPFLSVCLVCFSIWNLRIFYTCKTKFSNEKKMIFLLKEDNFSIEK